MRGLFLLSWRHLSHHKVQSLILALCIAVPVFLPLTTEQLVARYEASLTARAETTPLVMGPRGNRFDLTLAALYFRQGDISTIPLLRVREAEPHGLRPRDPAAYPLRGAQRAAGRDEPRVLRLPRPAPGPGHAAASPRRLRPRGERRRASRARPGDHIFSDQRELYDISKPPALKMRITGVLARAAAPTTRRSSATSRRPGSSTGMRTVTKPRTSCPRKCSSARRTTRCASTRRSCSTKR
jgi:putative ABC transport system permease protein